jgi:hypothetical protein
LDGGGRELFKVLFQNSSVGNEENHEKLFRIAGNPTGIPIAYISSRSLERYNYRNLLGRRRGIGIQT